MSLKFKETRHNDDSTTNYDVEFEKGLTIRKLVDIVLHRSPADWWGCIKSTATSGESVVIIEYRERQIVKQDPLFDKIADTEIAELKAQGGYSLMNYNAKLCGTGATAAPQAAQPTARGTLKICKCKSCGADIVWIKTTSGKAMPCDAVAVKYQNNEYGKDKIVLENGEVIKASVVTLGGLLTPIVDGEGYISHFATCPYAKYHRGGGRGHGG